jgi:hypothetical protein
MGAADVQAAARPAAAPATPNLRKLRRELDGINQSISFLSQLADLIVGACQRQQEQSAQARVGRRLALRGVGLAVESGWVRQW